MGNTNLLRKAGLSLLFILFIFCAWSQKKKTASANLEKQRTSLLKEIAQTEKELARLQSSKSNSLEALKVLQSKLNARNKLLNTIDREVQLLDRGIGQANNQIVVLRKDLKGLRKRYAELVRFSYKNRTSENFLLFLFSSKSFNDANRRLQYVDQYRKYRGSQAQEIEGKATRLIATAQLLKKKRTTKDQALQTQKQQNLALEAETAMQDKMVAQLKTQEGALTKKLVKKKQTAAQLNNAIAAAIQKEVALAQKRAMEEERKRQLAELAKKAKIRQEAIALAEKKAAEKKIAEAKKKRELELQRLAEEKRAREEAAAKLEKEKREREEREQRLIAEQKKRKEEERKARAMAEKKRKEREAELAQQKKEHAERQMALRQEKERQEALNRKLEEEKQKQKEYEKKLAKENKKRERLAKKKAAERVANAKKTGTFNNPRYVPTQADIDKKAAQEAEAKRLAKESVKKDYRIALSEADRNLSNNFAANKGRLPWPVTSGYISEHYGKNKHPVFNIYTENYGIDIKTTKGQSAFAIFAGEVSSVIFIPGAGQTVLVNHGSFYTVYSKLKNVRVNKGDKVKLKQVIGGVKTDENGSTQIHFEIWQVGANGSPSKVNPEFWVRKP